MTDYLEMALGPEEDIHTIGTSPLRPRRRVLRTAVRPDGAAQGRDAGPGAQAAPTGPAAGAAVPAETAGRIAAGGRAEDRPALPALGARVSRAAEVLWPRWTQTRRAVRWIERSGDAPRSGTDRGAADAGLGRDLDAALRTLDRTVEREARCYDAGFPLY